MTLPDDDTLATYGGPMQNYPIDVVDPTTDEDASYRNKYAANVAMMTRVSWRAIRSFLGMTAGATALADPSTGFVHNALWGSNAADKPVGTRIATGTTDLIWPATVSDELNESHTLAFKRAIAHVESSDGTWYDAKAKVTGVRTVRVYTYKVIASAITLSDLADQVITTWVR